LKGIYPSEKDGPGARLYEKEKEILRKREVQQKEYDWHQRDFSVRFEEKSRPESRKRGTTPPEGREKDRKRGRKPISSPGAGNPASEAGGVLPSGQRKGLSNQIGRHWGVDDWRGLRPLPRERKETFRGGRRPGKE